MVEAGWASEEISMILCLLELRVHLMVNQDVPICLILQIGAMAKLMQNDEIKSTPAMLSKAMVACLMEPLPLHHGTASFLCTSMCEFISNLA
jgi:hypothetical protein